MSRLLVLLVVLLTVPVSASGQQPDTTAAPDTTARRPLVPLGFADPAYGRPVSDSIPALMPAVDLVEVLERMPGSFTYLFATPGWPDGWSIYGLPPHETALGFGGTPFTHLFTGRPAFNLVPLALTEQPRLEAGRYGSPFAVLTRLRPFVSAEPITEGKYWKGGDGLHSIEAVHAQHRRRSLFGSPGFLNILGGYTGRAADGEYPGSRLRRARQVLLRLRYEQQNWSVEVMNLHNRREIGAHGGVIPDSGNFDSIYRRAAARVENPNAFRRIIRNDMRATLRSRLFRPEPVSVSLYWTAETFRYTLPDDTLGIGSDRLGLHGLLPLLHSSANRLDAHFEAWADRSVPDSGRSTRGALLHAYVTDSLGYGGWDVSAQAGVAVYDGRPTPTGKLWASRRTGSLLWTARLSVSGRRLSPVDEIGFSTLRGRSPASPARIGLAEGVIRYTAGGLDVGLGAFLQRRSGGVDYFAVGAGTAQVLDAPTSVRVGGQLDAGWRRSAQRGLYAELQPTVSVRMRAADSALEARLDDALPLLYGRARVGARYAPFLGDLDFDLYLEGYFWSALGSRMLHPETGLLIVPEGGLEYGPSSMIDVVLEARVRDAKIFLSYENVLSGTAVMVGNLMVPIYPLPARRFRIGVHWPITG